MLFSRGLYSCILLANLLFLPFIGSVEAQNNTFTLQFGSLDAEIGEEICLPVTVKNFTDILGMQMTFGYDPEVLDFVKVTNPNPDLRIEEAFIQDNFGYPEVGNVPLGRVTFFWVGPGARPLTLEEDTVLFEFCFIVKEKRRSVLGFYEFPTRIQVVDSNDQVVDFRGFVGFINKNETNNNNDSYLITLDTSFQSYDFANAQDPSESVTLPHGFEIINLTEDTINIKWELIENVVPENWNHSFITDLSYNERILDTQTEGSLELRNLPEIFNFQFQLNPPVRGTDTTIQSYLFYDETDSLNTAQIVTFISEFISPEVAGASFRLDTQQIQNYFLINSSDQFPVAFNYQIQIQNQLPLDVVQVKWEKLSESIPTGWTFACETGFECPSDGATFDIEANFSADWNFKLIVQNANQKTDTAVIEYLVYDPLDSINTQQIIKKELILEFPELTDPVYALTPTDVNKIQEQSSPNQSISFSEILNWNYSSITPRLITWEVLNNTIPQEWNYNFTINLGERFFEDGVNPIPAKGTFILDRSNNANGEINFEVTNLNGKPGAFDFQLLFYEVADSAATAQVLKINYSVCPPPVDSSIIIAPTASVFCPGAILTFEAVDGFTAYNWGNGAIGQTVDLPTQELISIEANDEFGCRYTDALNLELTEPFNDSICIVTFDENSGKNKVIWSKTDEKQTVSYVIYKISEITSEPELIGEVFFEMPNFFIDQDSDPMKESNRYFIKTFNSCQNELSTNQVTSHQTMLLTSNLEDNGAINLNWTPYEGFEYASFKILRGFSLNDLTQIAERPIDSLSYSDPNPPAGDLIYQIAIEAPSSCLVEGSEAITSTKSNVVLPRSNRSVDQYISNLIKVYPQPAKNQLTIDFPHSLSLSNGQIYLVDELGRQLAKWEQDLTHHLTLDISTIRSGLYALVIQQEQKTFVKKITILKN